MKIEWDIHHIIDKPISYHTHGLEQFGSLEIEIALPLYPHDGALFCNTIGAAIREGLKVEDGKMVEHLFNVPVFFFKTMPLHGDKEVYRVIFPDKNDFFPWDMDGYIRCDEPYKSQIKFDKDKVFFIEITDCAVVERRGTGAFSIYEGFEKRNGVYIRPQQYFIAGEKEELIRIPPYMSEVNGLLRVVNDLIAFGDLKRENVRVVCKDLDYADPINKRFCDWKEKYW